MHMNGRRTPTMPSVERATGEERQYNSNPWNEKKWRARKRKPGGAAPRPAKARGAVQHKAGKAWEHAAASSDCDSDDAAALTRLLQAQLGQAALGIGSAMQLCPDPIWIEVLWQEREGSYPTTLQLHRVRRT